MGVAKSWTQLTEQQQQRPVKDHTGREDNKQRWRKAHLSNRWKRINSGLEVRSREHNLGAVTVLSNSSRSLISVIPVMEQIIVKDRLNPDFNCLECGCYLLLNIF